MEGEKIFTHLTHTSVIVLRKGPVFWPTRKGSTLLQDAIVCVAETSFWLEVLCHFNVNIDNAASLAHSCPDQDFSGKNHLVNRWLIYANIQSFQPQTYFTDQNITETWWNLMKHPIQSANFRNI